MALLRLPCSPSTPHFSAPHHQTFHKTILFSSLHKPPNQTNHTTIIHNNNNSSLSWCVSHICSLSPAPNKITSHFVFRSSSTTQDPVVDSSSVDTPTQTQSESKTALVNQVENSRTRLLASNIPWTSTHEDIRSLFEKFGTVVDVELSMHNKTRNRGLAFVTMGSPEEAQAALTNLELTEFEGRTLKMSHAKPKPEKKKASPPASTKPPITFNLFIANLPFEAKEKDLKEFFAAECATVVSAEIIYHDNPRKPSGYGFVAFKSKKDADKALSDFPGKVFMGRAIRVARSKEFVRQRTKQGSQSDVTLIESQSNVELADKTDEDTEGDVEVS